MLISLAGSKMFWNNNFSKYMGYLFVVPFIIFIVFTFFPYTVTVPNLFLMQRINSDLNSNSNNSNNDNNISTVITSTVQICPAKTFLTVGIGGRLGNIIWEYLSVISVAKLYEHAEPFIPEDMKKRLLKVFVKINTKLLGDIPEHCVNLKRSYHISKNDKEINSRAFYYSLIVLPMYSVRYNNILQNGTQFIRDELTYQQNLIASATNFLNNAKKAKGLENEKVVYVGIHYRGGDYIKGLKLYYKIFKGTPNYRYYQLAMNYFRSRYKKVIFILITVDKEWLDKNIPFLNNEDVYVKPMSLGDAGVYKDLAILSHCNHSIISYGTYGAFGALYAGGETIAYDLGLEEDYRGYTIVTGISKILPNWHLCNNTVCNIN